MLFKLKGTFATLFEDNNYQYRDTHFDIFREENLDEIESTLAELGSR